VEARLQLGLHRKVRCPAAVDGQARRGDEVEDRVTGRLGE
jgi:hypothetical protein